MIAQTFMQQMICTKTRPGACFRGSEGLGHARSGLPPVSRPRAFGKRRLTSLFRSHRSLHDRRRVLAGPF